MAKIDMDIYQSMARILKSSGQLGQLTESFCANNSSRIDALRTAVARMDPTSTSEIVHALKGSCSMFGAKSCAQLCQQIEHILEKTVTPSDYAEISTLISSLEIELSIVISFLRAQANPEKPECCP